MTKNKKLTIIEKIRELALIIWLAITLGALVLLMLQVGQNKLLRRQLGAYRRGVLVELQKQEDLIAGWERFLGRPINFKDKRKKIYELHINLKYSCPDAEEQYEAARIKAMNMGFEVRRDQAIKKARKKNLNTES